VIQSPNGNEPCTFRRSASRVFYESEYSSPTSWEYRVPAMPLQLSVGSSPIVQIPVHVENSSYVVLSPLNDNCSRSSPNNNNNSIIPDGSRSSSSGSSSSSSQRSHDSGFSDTGENHKKGMLKSLHRSRKKEDNSHLSPHNNTSTLYHEMIVAQQHQLSNGGSPQMLSVVGSPDEYCTIRERASHTSNGSVNGSNHLGYPVCSSTPKRDIEQRVGTRISASRLLSMTKIDNLQTLNKNEKSLDNNNNSTGSHNAKNTSASSNNGCYPIMNRTVVISKSKTNSTSTSCIGRKKVSNSFDGVRLPSPPVASTSAELIPTYSTKSSVVASSSATFVCGPGPSVVEACSFGSNAGSSLQGNDRTVITTVKKAVAFSQSQSSFLESPEDRSNNNNNDCTKVSEGNSYSSQLHNSSRWDSLPNGFKRVPATSINASKADQDNMVVVKSHLDNEAMRLWLHEMRTLAEPECWHMLQTKSIPTQECDPRFRRAVSAPIYDVSSPLLSIRSVEQMANLISAEFPKICK